MGVYQLQVLGLPLQSHPCGRDREGEGEWGSEFESNSHAKSNANFERAGCVLPSHLHPMRKESV